MARNVEIKARINSIGSILTKVTALADDGPVEIVRVEGLGDFLELEVVLADGEHVEAGEAIARDLMEKLGVLPEQLIEGACIDLLTAETAERGVPPDR